MSKRSQRILPFSSVYRSARASAFLAQGLLLSSVFIEVNSIKTQYLNLEGDKIIHRTLTAFLLIISLIWGLGCESNNSVKPDTEPPAIPRGVVSITGDEQGTVEWFPNGERDLAGYRIWRSPDDDEFDLLAELSDDAFQYVDNDVRNGATYFYAVSAYDADGNESEVSPERVPDTPRPSGNNVTLDDFTPFA